MLPAYTTTSTNADTSTSATSSSVQEVRYYSPYEYQCVQIRTAIQETQQFVEEIVAEIESLAHLEHKYPVVRVKICPCRTRPLSNPLAECYWALAPPVGLCGRGGKAYAVG